MGWVALAHLFTLVGWIALSHLWAEGFGAWLQGLCQEGEIQSGLKRGPMESGRSFLYKVWKHMDPQGHLFLIGLDSHKKHGLDSPCTWAGYGWIAIYTWG